MIDSLIENFPELNIFLIEIPLNEDFAEYFTNLRVDRMITRMKISPQSSHRKLKQTRKSQRAQKGTKLSE